FATSLIRIQHRKRRRCAFVLVGQMMVGDDYVETVVARPVEWFVGADAAVNADDEFVTFVKGAFECGLLNAIAFGEAMRYVKAGASVEQFQRAQKDRCAGGAVDVVVAVDQDWFLSFDGVF